MQPAPVLPLPIIAQIEDGMVALLQPLAGLFDIQPLPEAKNGMDGALVKPRVTVAWRESGVSQDREESGLHAGFFGTTLAQKEKLYFSVVFRGKTLRNDKTGVYAALDVLRRLLAGKKVIPGIQPLTYEGQRLEMFDDKATWQYSQTYSTSGMVVADVIEDVLAITQLYLYFQPSGPQTATQIV